MSGIGGKPLFAMEDGAVVKVCPAAADAVEMATLSRDERSERERRAC